MANPQDEIELVNAIQKGDITLDEVKEIAQDMDLNAPENQALLADMDPEERAELLKFATDMNDTAKGALARLQS